MTKVIMMLLNRKQLKDWLPFNDDILVSFLFNFFMGDSNSAATLQWILQQLQSKTVHAHIGAFPNYKTPFFTQRLHEKSGIL